MKPINHYKHITIKEVKLIEELKKEHQTIKTITLRLGRTENSIRNYIYGYHLPTKKCSKLEIELLINEYSQTETRVLAKKLNRSVKSIYNKAYQLKLFK